jgi:hypothetical protein
MSLSEAAQAVHLKHAGGKCSIGVLITRLDPGDKAWLLAKMSEPVDVVQHTWLSRVLAQDGHRVAPGTLARHRAGECGCR